MHLFDIFQPKHLHTQSAHVLESFIFLKQKRYCRIKGCILPCSNRRRDYIPKKMSARPKITTDTVLITCIIYAKRKRLSLVLISHIHYSQTCEILWYYMAQKAIWNHFWRWFIWSYLYRFLFVFNFVQTFLTKLTALIWWILPEKYVESILNTFIYTQHFRTLEHPARKLCVFHLDPM